MNKAKRAEMLRAFSEFSARITAAYDQTAELLRDGDYVAAHEILSELAQSHAKTSLSLRNLLVKEGLMEDQRKRR
jgi:hypothetical protein